jgi:hypothetical protein
MRNNFLRKKFSHVQGPPKVMTAFQTAVLKRRSDFYGGNERAHVADCSQIMS